MAKRELVVAHAEQLVALTSDYLDTSDRLQIMEALEFARQEHGDQRRRTGELFFTHPLTVATYLAAYRLDAAAISAALLHDIAEDIGISIDQISERFGPEVGRLVDGVTKLKEVTRGVAKERETLTTDELQQATLQKLLQAMTADVRTVIIKLFDRLHNMRTIHGMLPHRQRAKAEETLAVYAPLAYRLGMWEVKSELESLSLQVLQPHVYESIRAELERLARAQAPLFEVVREQIDDYLTQNGLPVAGIKMSPENIYTVYKDLEKQASGYRDVDRMLRVTILLEDSIDCYTALGHLHYLWSVVPHRFDDYISVRRENLYQSLHTTLVHSSGQPLKVRLRTVDMDRIAQIGVLAKWYYAGTPLWSAGLAERVQQFFANISQSIGAEPQNPVEGARRVVADVLSEQIRVYSKDGDPFELPQGSTPLDFAYKVHTALGNQCSDALVNDLPFPLNKPLKNGDQVRIIKNVRVQPRRAWLDEDLGYITTNTARSYARRWFRKLSTPQAIRQGRDILLHELEMLGLLQLSHEDVAKLFDYETAQELYYGLGRAELLPTVLSTRIMSNRWDDGPSLSKGNVVVAADGSTYIITDANHSRLHLCGTCDPRPRDPIVGYLRRDGVLTVHRNGCRILNPDLGRAKLNSRLLKLGWGEADKRMARIVPIHVDVYDRPHLLHEMTQLMDEKDINIRNICTFRQNVESKLYIELELEVTSPRQMVRILHQIESLVNVRAVRCVPAGFDAQPRPNGSSPYYWPE
ncbi:MAG: bifunctional (p)ppGpp synthetase/guanosine-3',5'-bis(diphosphate) 3'-pyrophosphohydrolase [Anaerolineae bacterium]|uniref:RelA/SpoT family protein n=1 Tax=Promineifilum sp. TaxID=2664178 RepID=UPI001D2908B3|nr:bifunctional (p)ppGpp synthetase/guanosine-3',5'-bis(diphosphate) 3'-pyrophosphohydrolase [Anaerolineales bacterium]MCB8935473.1 bifunctional (p)ppGpp synthetase/guanosine-3',5'-bis(diphosphate) 3'-pyrophosphohydrolase [Promineifilum sp.]MCO5180526.1 RelA/SpoT family protein [Promineifilum sp.]MCW5847233.1 bifunctional (p)ppGpp synthetase/guanosine-3',5'-bis(diphosphate) 3'-pyrophosphohydrolase [Anaerolineae bacterium]